MFSTATPTCRSETHRGGLSMHRPAAEGPSRQIHTPGITQLCSQCCYSSYLQKILKHFSSIPFGCKRVLLCLLPRQRNVGKLRYSPGLCMSLTEPETGPLFNHSCSAVGFISQVRPQLKLYHSAHKQSIQT